MADNPSIVEAEIINEDFYDANDPEAVNSARKKAGRRKKNSLRVVEALMQHSDGREWLYMLLTACDLYRASYMAGAPAGATEFREGKRFIGLQLLADIRKASPSGYLEMITECDAKKLPPLFPQSGLE